MAIARRYLDGWESGDPAVFDEVLAPDFFDVMYGRRREREALLEQSRDDTFVDRELTIDDALTSGDTVALPMTGRCTHAASRRQVTVSGMIWLQIEGGRIVTGWGVHDRLGQLQQLGVLPSGPTARAWLEERLRALPDDVSGTGHSPLVGGASDFRYRGARALVILHERELRRFVTTWREAIAAGVTVPEPNERHYRSLHTILGHVLAAARGYLLWITQCLGLPDPAIDEVPEDDELERRAEAYLEHLLECWRWPLQGVEVFGARSVVGDGHPQAVPSVQRRVGRDRHTALPWSVQTAKHAPTAGPKAPTASAGNVDSAPRSSSRWTTPRSARTSKAQTTHDQANVTTKRRSGTRTFVCDPPRRGRRDGRPMPRDARGSA